MKDLPELKPCPFCGSLAVALVGNDVRCGNCCAVGPFGMYGEQAIKRWNERAVGKHDKGNAANKQKKVEV